jgi:hypothetical protein
MSIEKKIKSLLSSEPEQPELKEYHERIKEIFNAGEIGQAWALTQQYEGMERKLKRQGDAAKSK